MKWLKNFDRLLEIQRNMVWPSVLEMDPKQFFPEFLKVSFYSARNNFFSDIAKIRLRNSLICDGRQVPSATVFIVTLASQDKMHPFIIIQWSWFVQLLLCCKQFYASLDESVRLEMQLCSWKQFYASLDRSVQQEMTLCSWKQFYVCLDRYVQQEILLCGWKRFYASLDRSVWQEMHLRSLGRFYANSDKSVRQEIL